MRSRAVIFPFSCWDSMRDSPPPSSASRRFSRSFSMGSSVVSGVSSSSCLLMLPLHPAVDAEHLAGHVARLLARDEADDTRDVLDGGEPVERDVPENLLLDPLWHLVEHVRLDE